MGLGRGGAGLGGGLNRDHTRDEKLGGGPGNRAHTRDVV